ncbi:hypothetical protein C8J57DRAFT_1251207 [Mycena rebaudengoi]|nr:hypothetical protein C8J57DRAFT_1251207 [Mycena rebaudengoi]
MQVSRQRDTTKRSTQASFVVWKEEPLALPLGCLRRAARRDWDGRAVRCRRGKGRERGADNSGCEESPPEGTAKRAAGAEPTLPHNRKTNREEERARGRVKKSGELWWWYAIEQEVT